MESLYQFLGNLFLQIGLPISLANGLAFFLYEVFFLSIVLLVGLTFFTFVRIRFLDEKLAHSLNRKPKIIAYGSMALLGIVSPFCSCSAIPAFISLSALNVPTGALFVYLIVAPLVQETSMILLFTQFGLWVTLIYIIQGVIAGVITGLILSRASDKQLFTPTLLSQRHRTTSALHHYSTDTESKMKQTFGFSISPNPQSSACYDAQNIVQFSHCCDSAKSDNNPKKNLFYQSATEAIGILKKTYKYILIGVALGALIHGAIPKEWIATPLGTSNYIAPIIATLIGIPIYSDDVALIPVAKSLLDSGAALGTALSFVMASSVVSIPSFILLGSVLQKRVIIKLAMILAVTIIIIGYVFNFLQPIIL
ncbi:hypothetical protein BBW65_00180 [Helicobacter enhydrae]|uniref:Permease n=1 Tax=Helicobacter enhydrae TaxID=222136 RepID=A0A1B1U3I4_9HELI|nr:permease [Helicobacter enhydrae]ANV97333.1 hypothetical protein BBW65_00180 [Helicobacter enhydrae]